GKAPLERVGQARALLQFLANSVRSENTPYGLLLKQELETLQQHSDAYLYHEHLEDHNEPLYFFEFNERLMAKDLRYLGEVDFCIMVHVTLPAEVQQVLAQVAPNLIQMEQYLDFLRNRTFRQTLLCHEFHRPNYSLNPESLTPFYISSPLKPVATKPNLDSSANEEFRSPDNKTLTTNDPIVKAALVCLSEHWPRRLRFEELRKMARARLAPPAQPDPDQAQKDTFALGTALLKTYASASNSLLELSVEPSRFVNRASPKPEASRLARYQASHNLPVVNMKHQVVPISDFQRQVLP